MSSIDALIDHQASLQTQLDQVRLELLAWSVLSTALAILVGVLAWKVTHP